MTNRGIKKRGLLLPDFQLSRPLLGLFAGLTALVGVYVVAFIHAGTNASFSPTVIPMSATEIVNPGRGAYNWQYDRYGGDEGRGAPIPMIDMYARDSIYWSQLEPVAPTSAQIASKTGTYDLSILEKGAATAKGLGGKFGFRIAIMGMGDQRAPDYIINNQGVYGGNGQGGGNFAPNYNNDAFLGRIEALMKAIGAKYGNDPRFGVGDISFYGMYGEWHLFGAPSGATAINTASAIRIINAQVDNMPQMHWVMMYGNSDVSDAVHYAMGKVSSQGNYVGWRNDCLGSQSQGYAQTGSNAWNQSPNPQTDQWKRAPVVGELCGLNKDGSSDIGPGTFGDVLSQVSTFHYAMVGNGNTHDGQSYTDFPSNQQANWINSMKTAGYRYELRNVTLPSPITTGNNFTLTGTWANSGVTPTYENWNVDYGLKNSSGTSVWEAGSSTSLKSVLPTGGSNVASNTVFQVPLAVPAGTYTLYAKVVDPKGYYSPMQLAINGRQSDGSYNLGTVTVTAGSSSEPSPGTPVPTPSPTPATNLLTGKSFTASDGAGVNGYTVSNVNDNDASTRWISSPVDNVSLTADLGATYTLNKVGVNWAGDTTKNYQIQVSQNGSDWTIIATEQTDQTSPQQIDTTAFTAIPTGRYLRIVSLDRWNSAYGNSIWEFSAYGATATASPTTSPLPSTTPTPAPFGGDMTGDGHVNVFDLSYLLSKWATNDSKADLNNSGHVDIFDLSNLLSHWTG